MRLSSRDCPYCDAMVEHDGDMQEVGDILRVSYFCNECDGEFDLVYDNPEIETR